MIGIIVNGEMLDIDKSTDLSMEYTPYIFSEKLKEPYSTDFQIPCTNKNMRLLKLGDDDLNNFYGGTTKINGVFITDNNTITVNIQVVGYTPNQTITLFIVESDELKDFLNKKLGDIIHDNARTIYPWYIYSHNDTINFPLYDYGRGGLNVNYAQLHPTKTIAEMFRDITEQNGKNEGFFSDDFFNDDTTLTAVKKNVCPQNPTQILRCRMFDNNAYLGIFGGQHITNDVSGEEETNYRAITFNRKCTVSFDLYATFMSRVTWQYAGDMFVCKNGERKYRLSVPTTTYTNYCMICDNLTPLTFDVGDTLSFEVTNPQKYDNRFRLLAYLTITDYTITNDDYSTEMVYTNQIPKIDPFTYGGGEITDYTITTLNGRKVVLQHYEYSNKGSSSKFQRNMAVPFSSYQFFGFYTNIDREKTLNEFLYLISWLKDKKIKTDVVSNTIKLTPLKAVELHTLNDNGQVDYTTEKYGQTNYVEYSNNRKIEFSTIPNIWLGDEKVVKKTNMIFADDVYYGSLAGRIAKIEQYSEFEYDKDSGEYKCKFNDMDGFFIGRLQNQYILPVYMTTNIIGRVNRIKNIELQTQMTADFANCDFFNLDGYLYLITEANNDINSKQTTLKGILINNTENLTFNDNGELATN